MVTGGSRGIGSAIARLAAQRGWAVAVNYHHQAEAAAGVVAAIEEAGGRALAVQANVALEADIRRLFDTAEAAVGPLAGLVNNAGILRPKSHFADISLARWTEVFATNVAGSFLCAREAARRFSTRTGGRGGVIVNLSSMGAVLGQPGDAIDYAASKAAIETMTLGLGRELAAEGVRVNGVRPGVVDTDMQLDSGEPDRARRLAPTIPMRRVGTTMEIAEAVVWLLSDQASYVTGTTLTVSGGR